MAQLRPGLASSTSLSSPSSGSAAVDWLGGFLKSGAESIPELIGITPSTDTIEFRQDNPFSGFMSELAGMAVPYTGWLKATRMIGRFDKAVKTIGNLDKSPFLTGAAREAARFAPFEVGRVGVGAVVGDTPVTELAGEAAFNLAAGAGIGGLLHGVAAAGTRTPRTSSPIPGVDIAAPIQLQLRQLRAALPTLADEPLARAQYQINKLEGQSRIEDAPEKAKYVYLEDKNLESTLNRMFKKAGPGVVLERRKFSASKGDFGDETLWQAEAANAGLPENFSELGQYFRHISFSQAGDDPQLTQKLGSLFQSLQANKITAEQFEKAAKKLGSVGAAQREAQKIDRALAGKMESLGGGWFLTPEPDGLFVMAKKIAGVPGKGTPADKWVVFKTDQPGRFAQASQRWANIVVAKNSWVPGAQLAKDGGIVYDTTKGFMDNFPLNDYREIIQPGRLQQLLPSRLKGPGNELAGRLQDAAKEYLAPAAFQFKKSPLANWIHVTAKAAYDSAETLASEVLYGKQTIEEGRNLFMHALRNNRTFADQDSIKGVIDGLDDNQIKELHALWKGRIDPSQYGEEALAGRISVETARAATRLSALDEKIWGELSKAMGAAGEDAKKGLRGHLGLSRQWEGDSRIALRDDAGKIVAVAAGPNRRSAQASARRMEANNPGWKIAEEFDISNTAVVPKDLSPVVRSPGFLLERQNIQGFRWDETPWTREELMEAYGEGVRGRFRYQANLATNDLLSQHLARLGAEDPTAHRMLTARLNDLAGVQSAFSQVQNKFTDQILAPLIGVNSASKIVGATNTAMWTLQLGMGKLSYPILNALTFVQTVMPEAAFVMNAPGADLNHYTFFAAGGTKGPVGAMGVLSPMKLMVTSGKEMGKPSAKLLQHFERAVNERVIDPRLVEEYVGESATKIRDLKAAFSSGSGFVGWIRSLSEFLPAHSERMARAHAFTTGHILGRDILRIADDDALYRFSRQFTEKTMYLYSAADRPRVFTTPVGSSLGLFKTWMMNYMSSMLEYTQLGMTKNVWSPLVWQTAGTMGMGGISATPLYWMADGFSKAFSDQSLLQNAYGLFQEDMADALMFGLPAGLSEVSLYSQTDSPLSNPVRDASMLFSAASFDRLAYTSKALGQAFDYWQATGEHPGRSAGVRDNLAKAFAPVTLQRALAGFNDGAIRSLSTKYPMIQDVPAGQRMAYAFGFNPTDLDKMMAVSTELYAKKEKRLAQIKKLGNAFYEAQVAKDSQQMKVVLRQAAAWGLDPSSVLRSAMGRQQRGDTDAAGRHKASDVAAFKDVLK